jgi:iron complex transport system permease protein
MGAGAASGHSIPFVGLRGNINFVLELRLLQLAGLLQVAVAIAVSTVVFQTVTGNRILSPSIMGLDALYLFCQTVLIFVLGGVGFSSLPLGWKFAGEVGLMLGLSLLLFLPLLRPGSGMVLIMLAGFVMGFLFRSLSLLLARLIDPNDFAVLQGVSFASFQSFDPTMVAIGGFVTVAGTATAWHFRRVLDVIALGRDTAIGLGLDWNRWTIGLLVLVVCMVATATALVGPLAFLGLLVVALAERLCATRSHSILLPVAIGVAVIILVGAQALSRFGFDGAILVSVVVEFAGGIVFIALVLLERRK